MTEYNSWTLRGKREFEWTEPPERNWGAMYEYDAREREEPEYFEVDGTLDLTDLVGQLEKDFDCSYDEMEISETDLISTLDDYAGEGNRKWENVEWDKPGKCIYYTYKIYY